MTNVPETTRADRATAAGNGWLRAGLAVLCLALAGPAFAADEEVERWSQIRESLFGQRPIEDGAGVIALEAPYRAEDAAVVPVSMSAGFEQTPALHIKRMYLVVDENPSPIAAVFNFPGEQDWQRVSTRIRINSYTHVRAIAETNDERLYMASSFVKASGGCSAPALKDPALAAVHRGRMKLVTPEKVEIGEAFLAQLMVRHPNSSGLQFDQITRHYIPADFVRKIEVSFEGEPVLTIDADISISEDPSIEFGFKPEQPGTLAVVVKDSKGREFDRKFDIGRP